VHPDNFTQQTGKISSASLMARRKKILLLRQHRGAAGSDLGTTIKHLRQTTSGAAGNGLGTTAKYLRRTMGSAAVNGKTQLSSTCNAQRAASRASD
jgi:hypothetical protein